SRPEALRPRLATGLPLAFRTTAPGAVPGTRHNVKCVKSPSSRACRLLRRKCLDVETCECGYTRGAGGTAPGVWVAGPLMPGIIPRAPARRSHTPRLRRLMRRELSQLVPSPRCALMRVPGSVAVPALLVMMVTACSVPRDAATVVKPDAKMAARAAAA